ncbi:phage integrase SAM-like domain-containing protein [Dyadobacter sp. CY343]|uniref:tyrosine-type recombinase/integrase n=1 Tax=Dyadobacter sp. CY343 TaxID=2907299 RepID=UPI001F1B61CC|nr:phage integrase SAM-like domain-containing protein [Dyadobacter sp. CY343]MCE7061275.1 site-specific integrase [Dyadobacter sp. CY343]
MLNFKRKMNVSVNFFLRGKEGAKAEKRCAIYAVIELNGKKSIPFSTKLKVPAKYWLTAGSRREGIKPSSFEHPVSSSFSMAAKFNEDLINLRKFAHEACGILTAMDIPVSADAIKGLITNPRPLRPDLKFIEVVDELRDTLTQKKRKGSTMANYRTRRNNIQEFLLKKGYVKLTVSSFKYQHFEEFQLWMFDQKNDVGQSRFGRNTINKHLTLLNQTLKYAVNKEYIRFSPIGAMGLEYDPAKPPQYLLADARKRIFDCDLESLEKERDVAVFLMNTGLSYTDYLSLRSEHLYRLPSGEWFIKKSREKSDIFSIIPLLGEAQAIISKYNGVESLPKLDMSDFNKTLKVLGEICRAPFSLSTSVFRETFSSMMENEYMIPERPLMFMMGHSNPRQLRNYSSVMPSRMLHELNKSKVSIPFNIEAFNEIVKAS